MFDDSDPVLSRDGALMPFSRLRFAMVEKHIEVHTADYLINNSSLNFDLEYNSFGIVNNYKRLLENGRVKLKNFVIMEPPVVAPKLYKSLPELTKFFERVYVHNTIGDGYALKGVDLSKLRTLFWPQPHKQVLDPYWSCDQRQNRIVVINSNHIPRSLSGELYSKRIDAMVSMAKTGLVDLYGHGWHKWWSHRSMWPPYWLNYRTLMSIYRGSCESKYEILSQYRFSLCFENMEMDGYVTEKIFDCLYAGCIPLYLGAKNINKLIPPDAYIDCRKFASWDQLIENIMLISNYEISSIREAGRAFIEGPENLKYYNSLVNIFSE